MTTLSLLLTSFSSIETARTAVRSLVEESLVACGTILPHALSIYSWEGKIEEAAEILVLLKTTTPLLESCIARLKELHPYEVPEMIAVDPAFVSPSYLKWVEEVLGNKE